MEGFCDALVRALSQRARKEADMRATTCERHGILRCAYCTLGERKPDPIPTEGSDRKRYEVRPIDYLYPLYNQEWRAQRTPPVQYRPFGHGCTTPIPQGPAPQHAYGPWRTQRNPQPQPVDALTEAQRANRALAARLGITLPD
jgi:hypothetical protein